MFIFNFSSSITLCVLHILQHAIAFARLPFQHHVSRLQAGAHPIREEEW